jgi:hypothetical protein
MRQEGDELRIDVHGWPEGYVKLVESYAEQLRKEAARRNGAKPAELPELPVWSGISLPPKDVRKAAYGDE